MSIYRFRQFLLSRPNSLITSYSCHRVFLTWLLSTWRTYSEKAWPWRTLPEGRLPTSWGTEARWALGGSGCGRSPLWRLHTRCRSGRSRTRWGLRARWARWSSCRSASKELPCRSRRGCGYLAAKAWLHARSRTWHLQMSFKVSL